MMAPERATRFEASLSPLAARLEARAAAPAVGPDAPSWAAVCFAPWELDAASRSAWRDAPELALVRRGERLRTLPERADPDLWRLEGPEEALEELGHATPAWGAVAAAWREARGPAPVPSLMGVINVTPDSFSDGGRTLEPEAAIARGRELAAEGAVWLDVGGESTRPGAEPVGAAEERARVLPVVEALAGEGYAVSVDTRKASVAEAALDRGARMLNDVSAGRDDPRTLALAAERGPHLVLMHMQGTPRSMQRAPSYRDVVREVTAFLRERAGAAWSAGVDPSRILVDPGIGFGKRLQDNLALLRALPELRSLGLPLLVGVSRKSFLSAVTGAPPGAEKVPETSAAVALGAFLGAALLRVHDVGRMRPLVQVAAALAGLPVSPPHPPTRGS